MFRKILVSLLAFALFTVFVSLGSWQLQRRVWKLDLISKVESQLTKSPVPAPGRDQWDQISWEDAYLPVTASGNYLHSHETFVQAMTSHGSGFWLITPLQQLDGTVVLVNRGFVDSSHQSPASRSETQPDKLVNIEGFLRLSEPDGRFLSPNDPAKNRWFSRDVAAIGKTLNLPAENLAPYFIDAAATANAGKWPVGGLTVVKFRNTHLVYAITWYALGLLTLVGAWIVLKTRGK